MEDLLPAPREGQRDRGRRRRDVGARRPRPRRRARRRVATPGVLSSGGGKGRGETGAAAAAAAGATASEERTRETRSMPARGRTRTGARTSECGRRGWTRTMVDERGWAKIGAAVCRRRSCGVLPRRARSRDDVDERRDAGARRAARPRPRTRRRWGRVRRAPLEVARSPPREQWLPSQTWAPRHPLVVLAAAPEPLYVSPRASATPSASSARVDMMLEDDDEAAILASSRPGRTAPTRCGAVELDLSLREPTSPLNKKEARARARLAHLRVRVRAQGRGRVPLARRRGGEEQPLLRERRCGRSGARSGSRTSRDTLVRGPRRRARRGVRDRVRVPAGDVFFNGKIRTDTRAAGTGTGTGTAGTAGTAGRRGQSGRRGWRLGWRR